MPYCYISKAFLKEYPTHMDLIAKAGFTLTELKHFEATDMVQYSVTGPNTPKEKCEVLFHFTEIDGKVFLTNVDYI